MDIVAMNADQAYRRIKGPFDVVEIGNETQATQCYREFEGVRSRLLEELSCYGEKGYRDTNDFDITESQVCSVGVKLFRYIDVCVIAPSFLTKPFFGAIHKVITLHAPKYCVSVHTDVRFNPRMWVFLTLSSIEVFSDDRRLQKEMLTKAAALKAD